jgi:hypothetical protein
MKIEININVSDKLVAFMKRIFTVRNGVFTTAAILFGIGALLFADQITKPHTFKGGDIISAAAVNENFDALYSKVISNYVIASGNSGALTTVGNGTWALAPYNNTVTITTSGKPVLVTASVRQYKSSTCAQTSHATLRIDNILMTDPNGYGMASSYWCDAVATLSQIVRMNSGTHKIELMVMGEAGAVGTYGTFDYLMATELP